MLRRKISKDLQKWNEKKPKECLVIKGARQVGKTYIVEKFIEENFESHLSINFDLMPDAKRIFEGNLDADTIFDKIALEFPGFNMVPGKTAIFLDEIQSCPGARTALKSFAIDGRCRVIASGSLLGLSYGSVPSFPVGYERVIELRSLDFEEFLWGMGVKEGVISHIREKISKLESIDPFILDKMEEMFRLYAVVGGMPEAVTTYLETRDLEEVRGIQNKILSGYRDDIGKYSDAKDRDRIFACFDSIPVHLSEENKKFMFSRIEGGFVPAYNTYERSINWLSEAGVIEKCHNLTEPRMPLKSNVRENHFKIYMRDTGLLVSMLGGETARAVAAGDSRTNRGAVLENLAAECISKCNHKPYYFSKGSLEVDFITTMRRIVTALEAKSGNNTRAKSLSSIKERYGVKRRALFEKGNVRKTDDGIEHYPRFAFAFIDSMYDEFDTKFDLDGIDELNKRVGDF
ncbi:MAG: ATP-binding protein [Thermoplasmatales archaeon]|nr:ATP-binding protein [Thermoplasmatales archaeon]